MGERRLYVAYWQNKLADNKDVNFPDSLASELALTTDGFSFAFLKEVLYVTSLNCLAGMTYSGYDSVSSLVLLASGEHGEFGSIAREQVKALRKQLETKSKLSSSVSLFTTGNAENARTTTTGFHSLPPKPATHEPISDEIRRARDIGGKLYVA